MTEKPSAFMLDLLTMYPLSYFQQKLHPRRHYDLVSFISVQEVHINITATKNVVVFTGKISDNFNFESECELLRMQLMKLRCNYQ